MWPIQLASCLLFVGYYSPRLFVVVLRILCTKNYKYILWRPVSQWELMLQEVWAVDVFDWCKLLNTISSFRNWIHTGGGGKKKYNENWLGKDPDHYRGCPNKSARFNFIINAPFIQKVLIFLIQYKVQLWNTISDKCPPRLNRVVGDNNAHTLNLALLLGQPVSSTSYNKCSLSWSTGYLWFHILLYQTLTSQT